MTPLMILEEEYDDLMERLALLEELREMCLRLGDSHAHLLAAVLREIRRVIARKKVVQRLQVISCNFCGGPNGEVGTTL